MHLKCNRTDTALHFAAMTDTHSVSLLGSLHHEIGYFHLRLYIMFNRILVRIIGISS